MFSILCTVLLISIIPGIFAVKQFLKERKNKDHL